MTSISFSLPISFDLIGWKILFLLKQFFLIFVVMTVKRLVGRNPLKEQHLQIDKRINFYGRVICV